MNVIFRTDVWREIFGSIGKNKFRTTITVIGVVWGIFIYIALSGAAKGLDNGFERQFQGASSNAIFIWGQETSIPYEGYKTGRQIHLKISDWHSILQKVSGVKNVAPRIAKGIWGGEPGKMVRGNKTSSCGIFGDYPYAQSMAGIRLYEGGRFLNNEDQTKARKVCVIGEQNLRELFEEDENPIGQFISIDKTFFKVIGVHKSKPNSGPVSQEDIFIPFSTYGKMYNSGDNVGWFMVESRADINIVDTEKNVLSRLKKNHKIDPEDERALGHFNLGKEFARIKGFTKGMTFLSMIVGIATILGGVIGIGNILLISVKERTKEIGIRRALGATPWEVKSQIVLESVFLTLFAGSLGIILGGLVLNILDNGTKNSDFPYSNPSVPIGYVLSALAIMIVLGSLIGLIPAQRAVSIKPIEALREE